LSFARKRPDSFNHVGPEKGLTSFVQPISKKSQYALFWQSINLCQIFALVGYFLEQSWTYIAPSTCSCQVYSLIVSQLGPARALEQKLRFRQRFWGYKKRHETKLCLTLMAKSALFTHFAVIATGYDAL